jgi:hypothetical protein
MVVNIRLRLGLGLVLLDKDKMLTYGATAILSSEGENCIVILGLRLRLGLLSCYL